MVPEFRWRYFQCGIGMERSAFKMGFYGAGALWCVKERDGTFITFNSVRIARQAEDEGDGVVVPYRWGRSKR